MKGFQKASNLDENLNHTSRAKNQSTAEVNQPKEHYPMRQADSSQNQTSANFAQKEPTSAQTIPAEKKKRNGKTVLPIVVAVAAVGCVLHFLPKGNNTKTTNDSSTTVSTSKTQSDSTVQPDSTAENNRVEPTSTPVAPEDKSYTVADIYENNNIKSILSNHSSVTMIRNGENGKSEVQFFQNNGRLSMAQITYDANGTPTNTYVCDTDFDPFGIACIDDGYSRSALVYISSDLEELIRGYWSDIEDVENEQITDTSVENGMVVVATSGQDTWGDDVSKTYHIDPNTDNITSYEVSYSGQTFGDVNLTYDLPVTDTTSFVNSLIHADNGNEITFVSKVTGAPGSCTIQAAQGLDLTVTWARSPISSYTDEALTNKVVPISNPGTYYVAEDLTQEWDGN